MKYSELISFDPVDDIIQLSSADDESKAREYVQTFVMSDKMAENLKNHVVDQLQMDEVVDNKGVLIVGNYGTGKSHLMSVISAVAYDAENLKYLKNKNFAHDMECIAGRFEVLRCELTGITMPFRDFILGTIMDDFKKRGIDYELPDLNQVKNNKDLMQDIMMAFSSMYPDKGYLLVVDELLNFLSSRDMQHLVLDLEFLRVLGEMCSKSKFRIICGMQEKLFDNPKFGFVADTLGHVRDRITEMTIGKEDMAYVVSERILKKTQEQKSIIRSHLEKFSALYSGMSERMDEFVELFPIHPAYIDVLNKVYVIENRHILKNISVIIQEIFDEELPEDAPGIISYDAYWPKIKETTSLRTEPDIKRVLEASEKLEDIISHAFPKDAYKPLAIQIIYALSVHRLTTNGLEVRFGLTAENMKDDLCLYLPMPEQDVDFLVGVIQVTLDNIMTTVSGQFIVYNEENSQYYIDVDKTVDYDEKIKQRASLISNDELNRAFYKVIYSCLDWNAKQYVTNFEIYERDLNWASHNMFREGYLFMGLPGERSTAQPERDFYMHFMPPYGDVDTLVENLQDEVYFYFKTTEEFKDRLSFYASATELAQISENKDAYIQKATSVRKELIKFLSENKNTCFDVGYNGQTRQLIEVLRGKYNPNLDFKDTIDLAASLCLDEYFNSKYPEYPVMKTKITRMNMADNVRLAFDYFAGRKTSELAAKMLSSFDILDGDKIKPEGSKYAAYYIDMLSKLQPREVINYSDIFEARFMESYEDKHFHIEFTFTPIIFLSMVYGGFATITLNNGTILTASNLDQVPKISAPDLYEFKYLSKPAQGSMAELKKLFDSLEINPAILDNPDDRDKGVEELLKKAQELSNSSVLAARKLQDGFELWGEPLVNTQMLSSMQNACDAVRDEFSNYNAKYNTPAKLNNFSLSLDQVDELMTQIDLIHKINEYVAFQAELSQIVSYISNIEFLDLDDQIKEELESVKTAFRESRDSIADGQSGDLAAHEVEPKLNEIKNQYIDTYFAEHQNKRLDVNGAKRKGKIQESQNLCNLRKLYDIEILSGSKLSSIEQDMQDLTTCFDLTPTELKTSYVCPHCGYRLGSKERNVKGQLDNIETRIDDLISEWTNTLLNTLTDPIVSEQKEYLPIDQQKTIDAFTESGKLPDRVDDFFINCIKTLLKGFEPVVINEGELATKLEELGPCDINTFKSKLNSIVDSYVAGKDAEKIRIVVQHKDSEG